MRYALSPVNYFGRSVSKYEFPRTLRLVTRAKMLKSGKKRFVYAFVAGVVLTLLTGLFVNTPDCVITLCEAGAVYYGYPFTWLEMRVVAPPYFPWVFRLVRLILDIVVWTAVVWVILFIVSKVKKK